MLVYPDIDPVAISFGAFKIYWYGISYLCGFLGAYGLVLYRCKHMPRSFKGEVQAQDKWSSTQVLDLLFYVAIGVIIGGRVGYIFIYEPLQFLESPLTIFAFRVPGRSFHGGLIGVLLAVWVFALVHKRKFFAITDLIAPAIPVGLGLGRIGNFINGELWGRVTDVGWGMVFPHAGPYPRHPSQLYEFALEGVLLLIILQLFAAKSRAVGAISGMFLFCYGVFRFLVEYVREPDPGQGFMLLDWVTMGQLLSVPMIALGLWLLLRAKLVTAP